MKDNIHPRRNNNMKTKLVVCSNCDKEVTYIIKKENKEVNVKGDIFNVEVKVAYCSECHEKVFPDELAKENDLIIYDEYRRRHNLLTSEEIKAIRLKRNMSQTQLANFIHCGEKNIARYETGKIQDAVFDQLIRMVNDDKCYQAMKEMIDKENNDEFAQFM